ncbi:hypothetical protein NYV52_01000 [Escherichia coli]|nr:hypothetical protein [Escherichia coli]
MGTKSDGQVEVDDNGYVMGSSEKELISEFMPVNRKQIIIWDCIYSLYLKMVKSDIQPTMKIACS